MGAERLRLILAVHHRQQTSQMSAADVLEDMNSELDSAVESFRRLCCFSIALAMWSSSKCCTPVNQASGHFDLLQLVSEILPGFWVYTSGLHLACALSL